MGTQVALMQGTLQTMQRISSLKGELRTLHYYIFFTTVYVNYTLYICHRIPTVCLKGKKAGSEFHLYWLTDVLKYILGKHTHTPKKL